MSLKIHVESVRLKHVRAVQMAMEEGIKVLPDTSDPKHRSTRATMAGDISALILKFFKNVK